ncbi:hypothetical protein WHI96_08890 [Pseudonocardia tropica]|uniref:MFS transporter n=1 Tax=Pseudonocardia tropica TaxID=681289 RepID=A0ABV1JSL8_9PSEU
MTTAVPGDRRPVVTLVVAVPAACVAFQLNASMLSPALVTTAREPGTDDAAAETGAAHDVVDAR